MKQKSWKWRTLLLLSGVILMAGVGVAAISTGWKYTPLGHVARFVAGESGAEQTANDLADELQQRIGVAKLQQWTIGILARYQSRTLKLAGKASYWSEGKVKLAPAEVPAFLLHTWPNTPEVSIRLSGSGQPECVVVGWYLYGIFVGAPSCKATENPWYLRQVQPGVYVYHGFR